MVKKCDVNNLSKSGTKFFSINYILHIPQKYIGVNSYR